MAKELKKQTKFLLKHEILTFNTQLFYYFIDLTKQTIYETFH